MVLLVMAEGRVQGCRAPEPEGERRGQMWSTCGTDTQRSEVSGRHEDLLLFVRFELSFDASTCGEVVWRYAASMRSIASYTSHRCRGNRWGRGRTTLALQC